MTRKKLSRTTAIIVYVLVGLGVVALVDFALAVTGIVKVNRLTQPPEEHTVVYLDTVDGRDGRYGRSPDNAVATLGRAIELLAQRSSLTNCTIQISGSDALDVGTDQVVNFLPAMRACEKVVIRGERANMVTGTVQTLTAYGPYDTWERITTTATLVAGTYEGAHIENTDTGRIYVVADNAATTIDTISGDVAGYEAAFEVGTGVAVTPAAGPSFVAGAGFEIYTLATRVTFEGSLRLAVPFGKVELVDLIIDGAIDSSLQSPSATDRVAYRGCRLISSTDVDAPATRPAAFAGSYFLEGCFLQGTAEGTTINRFEPGACISAESVWINATSLSLMSDCHLYYVKATDMNRKINAVDAHVALYAVDFDGVDDFAFISFVRSQSYARDVVATRSNADNTIAPGFNTAFDFRDTSVARWDNVNVDFTAVTTGPGAIRVAASTLFMSNFDIAAYSDVFTALFKSEVHLGGGPVPRTAAYESTASRCVLAQEGSHIYHQFNIDHVMTCATEGILALTGSKITIGGTFPATITANTGGEVVSLQSGSTGIGEFTALTQAGGGDLLKVGGNAAGNWLSQTDFAAGTPQFCVLYTSTPIP